MSDPPVVYIVDDDPSVCTSLRRLMTSIGLRAETFPNAQAFLEHELADAPACLVLDVRLPGASGLDLQDALARAECGLPIVFITAYGDVPMSVRAMKAGAVDFLTKPFGDQDLLDAVQRAIERDTERRQTHAEVEVLRDRHATLTPREREVFKLVVTGMLNKQIADQLGISEKTVKVHRANVRTKMQAASLAELVRISTRLESASP